MEGEFQGHDERIVDESQNSSLRQDMGDLARTLGNVCFTDSLEGVYPLRVLLANLHHFAKTPLPDDFQKVESFDCEWLVATGFEVYFEVE